MVTTVVANGNSYNDGSTPPGNMGNGGHRENLLKMLADVMADMGKALITSSASSLTIGTGAKVFILSQDRPFAVGAYVLAVDQSSVANLMYGQVTAKAGTSMTVTVTASAGAGTIAAWSIMVAGPPGAAAPDATETVKGIAELATQVETNAGVDDARIVTPLKAATYIAAQLAAFIASQAQADAGTDDAHAMTPLKALIATGRWKPAGDCLLIKSGANLQLNRYRGTRIFINGKNEQIPASGPTLAATGLTPGTLYYIYVYMNAGVMTLEPSATGHSADATYGNEIKTGDGTRSLVGMARVVTGPAWASSRTQAFVRSWFNDPGVDLKNVFTAVRSTSSGSFVEINSEIRCEGLVWTDEAGLAIITGNVTWTVSNTLVVTAIGIDGTTPEDGADLKQNSAANYQESIACAASFGRQRALSEGYHYWTLLGLSSVANNIQYDGSAVAPVAGAVRCAVQVVSSGRNR